MSTIPIPTYLFDDSELISLADRLQLFVGGGVDGDLSITDTSPDQAQVAIDAITRELRYRGSPVVLNKDGSFSVIEPTMQ